MKLNHLTFGQLLKLESASNLCRVTLAYHNALAAAWASNSPGGQPFVVASAEFRFPKIARRYKAVLDFLRGSELKRACRIAASEQAIPRIPGAATRIRTCEWWTPKSERHAYGLALICKCFAEACGVPAKIRRSQSAYTVTAETNEFGRSILLRKPGCTLVSLAQFCEDGNMDFNAIFWWANLLPSKTCWRVNPLLRCLDTPDIADNAWDIAFAP